VDLNDVKADAKDAEGDERVEVLAGNSVNPVFQRLQSRVLKGAEPSELISSYDRMHHRHSRS
jgi:hypothetical protein